MKQRPLRLKLKQLKHFLVFSGIFVLLLFVFQNCGEPLAGDDELASVAATAPFAFDTRLDTIAHLSCSYSNAVDASAYYTFKGGAFRMGSGLKYNDSFISATGGYSPDKRQQVLNNAAGVNHGLTMALGVVYRSNLDNTANMIGSFGQQLSSAAVALQLPQAVGSPQRINSFSGQVLGASFPIDPSDVGNFRTYAQFSDNFGGPVQQDPRRILAQYYTRDGVEIALGSSGPKGNAYYVDFAPPAHITNIAKNFPQNQNIVSSITERALENREGGITGFWTCENYLIVRDLEQGWDTAVDNDRGNFAKYNELRGLLPTQAWVIDLTPGPGYQGHIVAKQASCYGNNTIDGANMQGTPPHYPANSTFTGDCTAVGNTCPHYFTLCKRN